MRFIPMSSVAGKPISTKTLGDGSIALDVALVDASGNQIVSFGGGTQYAEGTIVATATGTVLLAKDSLTPNLLDPIKLLQTDVSVFGSSLRGDDGTVLDWGGSNTGNPLGIYILGEKFGGGWEIIPGDINPVNSKVGLNVQAMPYDSSPFTVKGNKSDNAAIPGTDNVGALVALAETSPGGKTAGRLGLLSVTASAGDLRITLDGESVAVTGTVTANMGSVAADPFGANADSASSSGSISAKLRFIASTGIPITGTPTVVGPTASGASLTASPVTTGGLAKTANPTAVSDGQVVNSLYDKLGKQVVVGSLRDLKSNQQTTITSSTGETTIVTADATNFLDLYGLILTNTSATGTKVTIKDSTAGTTRMVIYCPATDTRGFMLPESAAHKQAANNNNWTATCGTSVASMEITALFVKNL